MNEHQMQQVMILQLRMIEDLRRAVRAIADKVELSDFGYENISKCLANVEENQRLVQRVTNNFLNCKDFKSL